MADTMKFSSRLRGLPSTLILELADDKVYAATQLVGGGLFDEYPLTGPEFNTLGPAIVDIVVHAEGTNFTANFNYDVRLQYKFRYGAWSGSTSRQARRTPTPTCSGSTSTRPPTTSAGRR